MRNAIVLLFSFMLFGCATPQFGNFVDSKDTIDQSVIVEDSITQLVDIFPPARSRFAIAQPTNDAFGKALVNGLRAKGYAIREYVKPSPLHRSDKPDDSEYSPDETGLNFNYVLDKFPNSDIYRISIMVGKVIITRAYIVSTLTEGYGLRTGMRIPQAMGHWARTGA